MTREGRATRIAELPAPMRQHLHELDDEEEAIAQAIARERWVDEMN